MNIEKEILQHLIIFSNFTKTENYKRPPLKSGLYALPESRATFKIFRLVRYSFVF